MLPHVIPWSTRSTAPAPGPAVGRENLFMGCPVPPRAPPDTPRAPNISLTAREVLLRQGRWGPPPHAGFRAPLVAFLTRSFGPQNDVQSMSKRAARRPKDDVQTSFGRPPNTMMKFTLDVECPKQHPKRDPKKLNLSIVC